MTLGPTPQDLIYCSVDSCPKLALAKTLCVAHYYQAWRKDALPPRKTKEALTALLKTRVTTEVERRLRKLSRQSGKTCSELIREAIEMVLTPK